MVRVARAMRGARARESAPSPSPALGPRKPLQAQAKHFQICGPFLQIFPKISSFILWKNKDLRSGQSEFSLPSKFLRRSPVESTRPAAPAGRHGGEHLKKNSTTFSFSEAQCRGLRNASTLMARRTGVLVNRKPYERGRGSNWLAPHLLRLSLASDPPWGPS